MAASSGARFSLGFCGAVVNLRACWSAIARTAISRAARKHDARFDLTQIGDKAPPLSLLNECARDHFRTVSISNLSRSRIGTALRIISRLTTTRRISRWSHHIIGLVSFLENLPCRMQPLPHFVKFGFQLCYSNSVGKNVIHDDAHTSRSGPVALLPYA